jgi:flagella basal body P-ring formation protein FlgA
MMRLALIFCFLCGPALADTVVAARTIRPQSLVTAQDLVIKPGTLPGTVSDPAQIIGMEARVALYAGRPVRIGDVGPPAVIDRNQIVSLIFIQNGLRISAEGRALDRAGVGEIVRVMNISSRNTISGFVTADGRVMVSQ